MKLSLQDIQRIIRWGDPNGDVHDWTNADGELWVRVLDEEQRLRDPTHVRFVAARDECNDGPFATRPRNMYTKACLYCTMPSGRHDDGCPYDGKTHLEKPPQPDEDNW